MTFSLINSPPRVGLAKSPSRPGVAKSPPRPRPFDHLFGNVCFGVNKVINVTKGAFDLAVSEPFAS